MAADVPISSSGSLELNVHYPYLLLHQDPFAPELPLGPPRERHGAPTDPGDSFGLGVPVVFGDSSCLSAAFDSLNTSSANLHGSQHPSNRPTAAATQQHRPPRGSAPDPTHTSSKPSLASGSNTQQGAAPVQQPLQRTPESSPVVPQEPKVAAAGAAPAHVPAAWPQVTAAARAHSVRPAGKLPRCQPRSRRRARGKMQRTRSVASSASNCSSTTSHEPVSSSHTATSTDTAHVRPQQRRAANPGRRSRNTRLPNSHPASAPPSMLGQAASDAGLSNADSGAGVPVSSSHMEARSPSWGAVPAMPAQVINMASARYQAELAAVQAQHRAELEELRRRHEIELERQHQMFVASSSARLSQAALSAGSSGMSGSGFLATSSSLHGPRDLPAPPPPNVTSVQLTLANVCSGTHHSMEVAAVSPLVSPGRPRPHSARSQRRASLRSSSSLTHSIENAPDMDARAARPQPAPVGSAALQAQVLQMVAEHTAVPRPVPPVAADGSVGRAGAVVARVGSGGAPGGPHVPPTPPMPFPQAKDLHTAHMLHKPRRQASGASHDSSSGIGSNELISSKPAGGRGGAYPEHVGSVVISLSAHASEIHTDESGFSPMHDVHGVHVESHALPAGGSTSLPLSQPPNGGPATGAARLPGTAGGYERGGRGAGAIALQPPSLGLPVDDDVYAAVDPEDTTSAAFSTISDKHYEGEDDSGNSSADEGMDDAASDSDMLGADSDEEDDEDDDEDGTDDSIADEIPSPLAIRSALPADPGMQRADSTSSVGSSTSSIAPMPMPMINDFAARILGVPRRTQLVHNPPAAHAGLRLAPMETIDSPRAHPKDGPAVTARCPAPQTPLVSPVASRSHSMPMAAGPGGETFEDAAATAPPAVPGSAAAAQAARRPHAAADVRAPAAAAAGQPKLASMQTIDSLVSSWPANRQEAESARGVGARPGAGPVLSAAAPVDISAVAIATMPEVTTLSHPWPPPRMFSDTMHLSVQRRHSVNGAVENPRAARAPFLGRSARIDLFSDMLADVDAVHWPDPSHAHAFVEELAEEIHPGVRPSQSSPLPDLEARAAPELPAASEGVQASEPEDSADIINGREAAALARGEEPPRAAPAAQQPPLESTLSDTLRKLTSATSTRPNSLTDSGLVPNAPARAAPRPNSQTRTQSQSVQWDSQDPALATKSDISMSTLPEAGAAGVASNEFAKPLPLAAAGAGASGRTALHLSSASPTGSNAGSLQLVHGGEAGGAIPAAALTTGGSDCSFSAWRPDSRTPSPRRDLARLPRREGSFGSARNPAAEDGDLPVQEVLDDIVEGSEEPRPTVPVDSEASSTHISLRSAFDQEAPEDNLLSDTSASLALPAAPRRSFQPSASTRPQTAAHPGFLPGPPAIGGPACSPGGVSDGSANSSSLSSGSIVALDMAERLPLDLQAVRPVRQLLGGWGGVALSYLETARRLSRFAAEVAGAVGLLSQDPDRPTAWVHRMPLPTSSPGAIQLARYFQERLERPRVPAPRSTATEVGDLDISQWPSIRCMLRPAAELLCTAADAAAAHDQNTLLAKLVALQQLIALEATSLAATAVFAELHSCALSRAAATPRLVPLSSTDVSGLTVPMRTGGGPPGHPAGSPRPSSAPSEVMSIPYSFTDASSAAGQPWPTPRTPHSMPSARASHAGGGASSDDAVGRDAPQPSGRSTPAPWSAAWRSTGSADAAMARLRQILAAFAAATDGALASWLRAGADEHMIEGKPTLHPALQLLTDAGSSSPWHNASEAPSATMTAFADGVTLPSDFLRGVRRVLQEIWRRERPARPPRSATLPAPLAADAQGDPDAALASLERALDDSNGHDAAAPPHASGGPKRVRGRALLPYYWNTIDGDGSKALDTWDLTTPRPLMPVAASGVLALVARNDVSDAAVSVLLPRDMLRLVMATTTRVAMGLRGAAQEGARWPPPAADWPAEGSGAAGGLRGTRGGEEQAAHMLGLLLGAADPATDAHGLGCYFPDCVARALTEYVPRRAALPHSAGSSTAPVGPARQSSAPSSSLPLRPSAAPVPHLSQVQHRGGPEQVLLGSTALVGELSPLPAERDRAHTTGLRPEQLRLCMFPVYPSPAAGAKAPSAPTATLRARSSSPTPARQWAGRSRSRRSEAAAASGQGQGQRTSIKQSFVAAFRGWFRGGGQRTQAAVADGRRGRTPSNEGRGWRRGRDRSVGASSVR